MKLFFKALMISGSIVMLANFAFAGELGKSAGSSETPAPCNQTVNTPGHGSIKKTEPQQPVSQNSENQEAPQKGKAAH